MNRLGNISDGGKVSLSNKTQFFIITCLVLIAIASQVWQPFFLGLHHDDWIQFAYLKADLNSQSTEILDRPGFKLILSNIVLLWNGNPGDLHWFISAINLLTATSIFLLIIKIQQLFASRNSVLALAASCLWLLAPWGLAYTLWASAAVGNLALFFYCLSMVCIINWQIQGFRNWLWVINGALLYSIALTIYQSVWFAFIPIFMWMMYVAIVEKVLLKKIVYAFLIYGLIQSYYLIVSIFKSPKVKSSNIVHTMIESILTLPKVLSFSFTANQVIIYAIFFGIALVLYFYAYRSEIFRRSLFLHFFPCAVGLVLCALIYASAGYQISGSGEPSRTTVMLTFWVSVLLGVLLSGAIRYPVLNFALMALILLPGLVAYPKEINPWIESWRAQSELLKKVNEDSFARKIQKGDIVYAIVPIRVGPVAIFGAPWDISPALLLTWSHMRPDLVGGMPLKVQIVPAMPVLMQYRFDQQSDSGVLILGEGWEIKGKRLWVWSAITGQYKQIKFNQPLSPEIVDDLLR